MIRRSASIRRAASTSYTARRAGQIIELWGRLLNDGNPKWGFADISTAAGAPADGDPVGFSHENGMVVLYRSRDGHVRQLSFDQRGPWEHEDLTEKAKTSKVAYVSGVFIDQAEKLNVIVQDDGDDRKLHELWFDHATNTWNYAVILTDERAAPAASSNITTLSCQSGSRRTAYISYRGENGRLYILSWSRA